MSERLARLISQRWDKAEPYLEQDIRQNLASGPTGTDVWELGSPSGPRWAYGPRGDKVGPYFGQDLGQKRASEMTVINCLKSWSGHVGQCWAILGTGYRTKLGQWTNLDQISGGLARPSVQRWISGPRVKKVGLYLRQDI